MKVKGVNAVIRGLATFGKRGKEITAQVVQAKGFQIESQAKQDAPKDMGKLAQAIIKKSEADGLRAKVEVGVLYGAFVEFGTGSHVDVPAELKTEASKFKGFKNGNFEEFLENIKAWCKRKGIDENAAYPIARSILRNGIKPQPYLYPAFVKYRAELMPTLRVALDKLVKETNRR